MAEFSKLVITKKGQALIAKIIAGQGAVEFTKIASSSASYNMEKLEELTVLDRMEQTSKISNITRTNEAAIKAEASFTNTDLTAGYYMRCLGLFSVDPEEGEILYAVTIETSGNCYMPPYNGVTVSGAYIQLVTSVGNAENVSLEIDPAAIATIGNIQELRDKMENQNTVNEVRFTEIQNHMIDKNNPHQLTKEQIGLGEVENTADLNKPVSTATQEAMETAYISNKEYVDTKVAALVNGAPEALDTLLELASAVSSNQELVDTLAEAIGKKATQTDFDSHKTNNTVHVTAVERTKWNTVDTIGNKTNQTDFDSHKNNSTVHVTAAERTKWNTVDTALSGTSLNPVQNKVVKTAFDQQNTKNGGFESSISQINSNLANDRKWKLLGEIRNIKNGLSLNGVDWVELHVCVYMSDTYKSGNVVGGIIPKAAKNTDGFYLPALFSYYSSQNDNGLASVIVNDSTAKLDFACINNSTHRFTTPTLIVYYR